MTSTGEGRGTCVPIPLENKILANYRIYRRAVSRATCMVFAQTISFTMWSDMVSNYKTQLLRCSIKDVAAWKVTDSEYAFLKQCISALERHARSQELLLISYSLKNNHHGNNY